MQQAKCVCMCVCEGGVTELRNSRSSVEHWEFKKWRVCLCFGASEPEGKKHPGGCWRI